MIKNRHVISGGSGQHSIRITLLVLFLLLWHGTLAAATAFVGKETNGGGSGSSLSINVPAGAAVGDLLIATLATDGVPTLNTPTGWTLIQKGSAGFAGPALGAFYRVVDGTEPTSYTFTWGGNEGSAGAILLYSGVNPANPIDAHAGVNSGVSSTPSISVLK